MLVDGAIGRDCRSGHAAGSPDQGTIGPASLQSDASRSGPFPGRARSVLDSRREEAMDGWIGILSGWAGLLALMGVSALGAEPEGEGKAGEDARLGAAFRAYLDEAFRDEPLMATRLGDHRHDDRLDDLSPEARAAHVERDRRMLAELPRTINYNALSRSGQVDYEIFRQHLARSVWLAENFTPFEDDPRIYGDYLTESVYLLLTQSSL